MNKKIIASVLAVAFAFSMVVVGDASAVTLEELQAQFDDLFAKYNLLLAQIGQPTTGGAVCFNTDLQQGMTSDSVKDLQIKLGVTPTSGYFGPITLAAVKTFQTANGIINTGYVGPLTRGALNAKYCTPTVPSTLPEGCTSTTGFSPTTGQSCATTTVLPEGCTSTAGFSPTTGLSCAGTTTTTVGPSYGTLTVQTYPVSNPVTTLYGGQTYELLAAQYKATGSDITLRKIAVQVDDSDGNSFTWQVFTTISVWDGATMLAELPVTSANAIEDSFANTYTFNISGLNLVIPNGTQKVLTVKGTVISGNPVSAVTGGTYTVILLGSGTVYADTAGVTYTAVSGDITKASLTIAAAQSSAITTTVATDNPLEGNVIGSTSATTKADLLKFNVKVENINGTFNSGTITATSSDATKLVSVELWDGSTLVASAAPGTGGAVSWTNFTLPTAAGTTKTFTVKGVIAQLTSGYSTGDTIRISTGPVLTGVDSNSNVITASGAAITGNSQRIYLIAPTFAYVTHSVAIKDSSTTTINNIGDTAITFSVTANGGDIYIPTVGNATSGKKAGIISGIDEKIIPAFVAATGYYATSTTWACTSPAVSAADLDTVADQLWRIPSGATANCTLSTLITNTVPGVPASTTVGYFSVAVEYVKWHTTATSTEGSFVDQNWGLTNIKTPDFYLYE